MENIIPAGSLIMMLYEMGKSRKDIADLLNMNERKVTYLCRCPWARLDYRDYAKLRAYVKETRKQVLEKSLLEDEEDD